MFSSDLLERLKAMNNIATGGNDSAMMIASILCALSIAMNVDLQLPDPAGDDGTCRSTTYI